jgi:hypothetical protein
MTLAGFAAHRDPEQSEINAVLALLAALDRRQSDGLGLGCELSDVWSAILNEQQCIGSSAIHLEQVRDQ